MLEFNFNWDKLSVSAGLTLRNFYFRLYPGAIGELEVIDFLKALVRHIDGPLLIVWDRLPAHRSRLVREFIELSEGSHRHGILAVLCAGAESGGIHLGVLEAARVAQRLPEGLLGTRRARPQSAAANAPQTALDYRFLETVFSLSRLTVYYARLSRWNHLFASSTVVSKLGSSPESVISFPRAAAAWRSSDRWRPRSARRCGSRRRDD